MAKGQNLIRDNPVSGNRYANSRVTIEAAPAQSRISFRANAKGAKDFGKSLGLELPIKPGQTTTKSGLSALWIGPDEWLVLSSKKSIDELMPSRENAQFCATDVSHRNVGFVVSGDGAEDTLSAACPRNLSLTGFPVGTASRTLIGKTEIILFRTGKTSFHLECWRSFSPYLWELLSEAARDAHNIA